MRTTDWTYDFSSLPRWDNRERDPWIYDEYFELPQSDTLCCLYSISEVSMMNYLGFVAILRNKQHPELVLTIAENYAFCPFFDASADGTLLFMQPLFSSPRNCVCPVLLLDLTSNRFACVLKANSQPSFRMTQKSDTVFTVEAGGRKKSVRTRWLKWYPTEKLPALSQILNFS